MEDAPPTQGRGPHPEEDGLVLTYSSSPKYKYKCRYKGTYERHPCIERAFVIVFNIYFAGKNIDFYVDMKNAFLIWIGYDIYKVTQKLLPVLQVPFLEM